MRRNGLLRSWFGFSHLHPCQTLALQLATRPTALPHVHQPRTLSPPPAPLFALLFSFPLCLTCGTPCPGPLLPARSTRGWPAQVVVQVLGQLEARGTTAHDQPVHLQHLKRIQTLRPIQTKLTVDTWGSPHHGSLTRPTCTADTRPDAIDSAKRRCSTLTAASPSAALTAKQMDCSEEACGG